MRRYINTDYPRLKDVNKAISDDVFIYGVFNLVLGAALYSGIAHMIDFIIMNDILSHKFWGATFFLAGAALLTGFYFNYWRVIKVALSFCLFLKIMWIVALTLRQFDGVDTNVLLILFFSTLGVSQISTYIRFPEIKEWKR